MTIDEILAKYPNINMRYTDTNIPIVDEMPTNYRLADEVECDWWWHIEGALALRVAGENGNGDWTDIVVPETKDDDDQTG